MAIQLNPEQEQIVGQAMRAGLIRGLDDVAEIGIAAIRYRLKARSASSSTLKNGGVVPGAYRLERRPLTDDSVTP